MALIDLGPCGHQLVYSSKRSIWTALVPRFLEVGGTETRALDLNRRQMFEVFYEELGNTEIALNSISEASLACFVGSCASGTSVFLLRQQM